jgi:hypothetical protein
MDASRGIAHAHVDPDRVPEARDGDPAAKPGFDKTRRAFRMALDFAVAAEWVVANAAEQSA